MGSCFRAMLACIAVAGSAALVLPAAAQKSSLDLAKRTQKARDAAGTLSERLRSELAAAIKSKGVVASLGLCQTISPDLVTNATDEFGFEAGRTALRLRNPENAPDEWELKVLQLFQPQADVVVILSRHVANHQLPLERGGPLIDQFRRFCAGETSVGVRCNQPP